MFPFASELPGFTIYSRTFACNCTDVEASSLCLLVAMERMRRCVFPCEQSRYEYSMVIKSKDMEIQAQN